MKFARKTQKASFMTVTTVLFAGLAWGAETMPVSRQNELIQRHCAVCHTDGARNGGLTLQHFDAARADPSLAAMLVSKILGGAVGADGKPTPDKATIASLTDSLRVEATGAEEWYVSRDSKTASAMTVSTLRRLVSGKSAGVDSLYRLALNCNANTHEGSMQLSWAPSPVTGTLVTSVDGAAAVTYRVEGSEKMGNGSPLVLNGRAEIDLRGIALPKRTLAVSGLWAGENAIFSLEEMNPTIRKELSACFTASSR